MMETKQIHGLGVKDVDLTKRLVQAYYSSYGTIDSDGDVIERGMYNKSIKERGPGSAKPRIKHLLNHWDAAGTLKELGEDDKGGWFLSKLGRHTTGNDVLLMYEDGIITEHSHGFEVIKSANKIKGGKDVRVLQEGVLWEVSSLDKWGANMNTGLKGFDDMKLWESRVAKLIKALRRGEYTDETMELFEIQLMQIQKLLKPGEVKEPPKKTSAFSKLTFKF
jgi:uncharacterized protein